MACGNQALVNDDDKIYKDNALPISIAVRGFVFTSMAIINKNVSTRALVVDADPAPATLSQHFPLLLDFQKE